MMSIINRIVRNIVLCCSVVALLPGGNGISLKRYQEEMLSCLPCCCDSTSETCGQQQGSSEEVVHDEEARCLLPRDGAPVTDAGSSVDDEDGPDGPPSAGTDKIETSTAQQQTRASTNTPSDNDAYVNSLGLTISKNRVHKLLQKTLTNERESHNHELMNDLLDRLENDHSQKNCEAITTAWFLRPMPRGKVEFSDSESSTESSEESTTPSAAKKSAVSAANSTDAITTLPENSQVANLKEDSNRPTHSTPQALSTAEFFAASANPMWKAAYRLS